MMRLWRRGLVALMPIGDIGSSMTGGHGIGPSFSAAAREIAGMGYAEVDVSEL